MSFILQNIVAQTGTEPALSLPVEKRYLCLRYGGICWKVTLYQICDHFEVVSQKILRLFLTSLLNPVAKKIPRAVMCLILSVFHLAPLP